MNSSFLKVRFPSSCGWVVLLSAAFLAGCGRDDIRVYTVPKEQGAPMAANAAAAQPMTDSRPQTPALHYKIPADWEETAPGEMRAASFRVKGKDGKTADVGVIPLPGLAGRDLDNVNRWRSSVGLAAVQEEELSKLAQPVLMAGLTAQLYDQGGENPGSGDKTRVLAAILRREGVAWFFKMNGDDPLVSEQKPAFIEFLKSVSFGAAPGTSTELPASHPPLAGGTMGGAGMAAASASSSEKPAWQVPSGWKELAAGQFLVAKFQLTGANNAEAAVNVSASTGDGGGVAANVNRWRKQLGLNECSDSELSKQLTPLAAAGGKAMLVDMLGTDARTGQRARLVGAIVPQNGQTWFYKLMGNEALVGEQKTAFTQFVETAKY